MKVKIFGILICMLLIFSTTTLALTQLSRTEQQMKHRFFNTTQLPLPTSLIWMKTFGGISDDIANSVQQTNDGGYIITGETNSFGAGGSDVWLIKTDDGGNKIWDKTFGGTNLDWGNLVHQTTDGGYIITGETRSYGAGDRDLWLIKTDDGGNKIWDKTFGGTNYDGGTSVQQTTDGGYIITGFTANFGGGGTNIWLIKTDDNGNSIWNKTFGGDYWDYGNSVQQTTDGGYIITGLITTSGAGDVCLIKTDNNGNNIWIKTFGGEKSDWGWSVEQTTDGGYIITGETWSFGAGHCDIWLIKTDDDGNKIWEKTFGEVNSDWGRSVQQTNDGGYIITGYKESTGTGDFDVWLIKTDNSGNILWDRTFGGNYWDYGNSVQQTTDSGYIITGSTNSSGAGGYDVWLIKTDSQGKSKTIRYKLKFQSRLLSQFPSIQRLLNL
ncbi:MAG: hypothetical protein JSV67_02460 [Thermoplasmatales archaeon]|nr:MAG: hypothetical protein JSV67_02460 [Thermoplasmatales archaeon]